MTAKTTEPLYVLFTMDCLPPDGPRMIRGPEDYADAQRNMASFGEVLADEGLAGTFFIAPEGLKRLKQSADDLAASGMELGILCHPQLSNYQSYLGSYGYDREREVVHLHRQMWEDALGSPTENFRAGFFSASDYTFQILCAEGFRQASCSLPGRIDPEQCSLWRSACPFPHHSDPLDRKLKGTMELYEVPVSSEFEAREHGHAETFTPPHLRVEEPDINGYAQRVVRLQLQRMADDDAAVKALCFVTHNAAGWGSPEDPLTERLHNLAGLLRREAQAHGMELTPATLAGVHNAADALWRNAGLHQ